MSIDRDEDHVVLTDLTQDELRQRLFDAGWKAGTADEFGQPETVTANPKNGDWVVFRTYEDEVYFHGEVKDERAFTEALGEEYEPYEEDEVGEGT